MSLRRIFLTFSLIIIFSCQENEKTQKIDIAKEIMGLTSSSDQEAFLERIHKTDQDIRNGESSEILLKYGKNSKELQKLYRKMDSVDQLNLKRVDLYLNTFQYPDKKRFSHSANIAPWLVIHHSSDINTRNKYFQILKKAYLDNDINSNQFELYLGRTYQLKTGDYPTQEGAYKSEDKINRLIKELSLE
ncbi:hypothetical protein [Salegentibacter mishustinae]|nr:hypothetical protein [Salegentibacter mishustinae]PNW20546.1 hypothetical protein APB85_04450 [Salegentibacter mishustinae]GGW93522.1 hypothetical protein GCM10008086_23360 [Salegentibacter mishustinae]